MAMPSVGQSFSKINTSNQTKARQVIYSFDDTHREAIAALLADADQAGKFDEAVQAVQPYAPSSFGPGNLFDAYRRLEITPS